MEVGQLYRNRLLRGVTHSLHSYLRRAKIELVSASSFRYRCPARLYLRAIPLLRSVSYPAVGWPPLVKCKRSARSIRSRQTSFSVHAHYRLLGLRATSANHLRYLTARANELVASHSACPDFYSYTPFVPQALATHPHLAKGEGIAEQLTLAHEVEVRRLPPCVS